MTRHTTPPGFDAYDLGRIFIGREQLDLFDIYLDRRQQLLFTADSDLDSPVTSAPNWPSPWAKSPWYSRSTRHPSKRFRKHQTDQVTRSHISADR